MKRLTVLAAPMVALLVGCSGSDGQPTSPPPTSTYSPPSAEPARPSDTFVKDLQLALAGTFGDTDLYSVSSDRIVGLARSVCKSLRMGAGSALTAGVLAGTDIHPTRHEAEVFVRIAHRDLCPNAV